jgi:hypothetical protein
MTNYTTNEIIEAAKHLKKDKHFLDKFPTKNNQHLGLSAASSAVINRMLPSKEIEAKKADELSRVFNTTTRAGAGGTKAGLVGLRPSGGKAASAFLENYTGLGRFKPQAAPYSEPLNIKETRNDNVKKPSVVLYKLCMDCMQPVSKDACVPNMTIIPPPQLCAPSETAKWQSVQLKTGDILCYLFCVSCVKDAQAQAKRPEKQIRVVVQGQETTIAALEQKKRGERISDQVFACVKNERNNPESDVFYGDAKIWN